MSTLSIGQLFFACQRLRPFVKWKNSVFWVTFHGFSESLLASFCWILASARGARWNWQNVCVGRGVFIYLDELVNLHACRCRWRTDAGTWMGVGFLKPWGVDVASGVEARAGEERSGEGAGVCESGARRGSEGELEMATVPRTIKVKIPALSQAEQRARTGHPARYCSRERSWAVWGLWRAVCAGDFDGGAGGVGARV